MYLIQKHEQEVFILSNKREKFKKQIATIGAYILSASDLMSATVRDYFDWTVDGAIKTKEPICGGDDMERAFWWMKDNYDSIAAAVRGAMYLSNAAYEITEQLWNEESELFLDKQEGGADNGKAQS